MTTSSSQSSNSHQPTRLYQDEILEEAKKQNVVAFLPTGSGKTYIAVLLIKHHIQQQNNCKIFFVVPSVPLVSQQQEQITRFVKAKVATLYGEKVSISSREEMIRQFRDNDIFVTTAEIMRLSLSHGYINMQDITLLVMDECHHTVGRNPYNLIMQDFYLPLVRKRCTKIPKVFGMTASPGKTEKEKHELEKNLNSKIYYLRPQGKQSLESQYPKPEEILVEYTKESSSVLNEWMSHVLIHLAPATVHFAKNNGMDEGERAKFEKRLATAFRAVCATKHLLGDEAFKMHIRLALESSAESESSQTEIEDKKNNMEKMFLKDVLTQAPPAVPFSQKLQLLWRKLEQMKPTSTCIVFVERRTHAFILRDLFMKGMSPELEKFNLNHIKCGAIVGNEKSSSQTDLEKNTTKTQQEVLKKFRNGDINVLFATSVIEEGLDVQACNLVIRFDIFRSFTSYIQSRGRARQNGSKYIIFYDIFDEVEKKQAELRTHYESQMHTEHTTYFEDEVESDDEEEKYIVGSTSAHLSMGSSVPMLYHFCSRLSNDEHFDSQPKFEYHTRVSSARTFYQCTLSIPPICQDFMNLSTTSSWHPSKIEAKRQVCFIVCKQLHQMGYLDDHLLNRFSEEDEHEDLKKMADTKHYSTLQSLVLTPVPQEVPRQGYVYNVTFSKPELETISIMLFVNIGKRVEVPLSNSLTIVLDLCSEKTVQQDLQFHDMIEQVFKFGVSKDKGVYSHYPCKGLSTLAKQVRTEYNGRAYILIDKNSSVNAFTKFETVHKRKKKQDYTDFGDYYQKMWGVTIKDPSACFYIAAPFTTTMKQVYLVPELCTPEEELPFSMKQIISIRETHKAIYNIISHLAARQLVSNVLPSVVKPTSRSLGLIQKALTPKKANEEGDFNLERLEFLGDSVLKLLTTVALFRKYPTAHEGFLTVQRSLIIRNRHLYNIMTEHDLVKFICSIPRYGLKQYICEGAQLEQELSMKSVADCFEAIIGAIYEECGFSGVKKLLHKFFPDLDLTWLPDFSPSEPVASEAPTHEQKQHPLEIQLKYSFKSKALLHESLTHPSYLSKSSVDTVSNQRLEFLGDAVIDFLIARHIIKMERDGSLLSPGVMSSYRAQAVCNESLSKLAVDLELHKLLNFTNQKLFKHIRRYVEDLQSLQEKQASTSSSNHKFIADHFIHDLNPPKALGDVYEAVVGAVFIDTGFDLEATNAVFPVQHQTQSAFQSHPVSRFYEWIQKRYGNKHDITQNIVIEQIDPEPVEQPTATSTSSDDTTKKQKKLTKVTIIVEDIARCSETNADRKLAKKLACKKALEILENDT